jgi:hypothetical protein
MLSLGQQIDYLFGKFYTYAILCFKSGGTNMWAQ